MEDMGGQRHVMHSGRHARLPGCAPALGIIAEGALAAVAGVPAAHILGGAHETALLACAVM
jgi:hypothetical protein